MSLHSPARKALVLLFRRHVCSPFVLGAEEKAPHDLLLKSKATEIACKTEKHRRKQVSGFCFRTEENQHFPTRASLVQRCKCDFKKKKKKEEKTIYYLCLDAALLSETQCSPAHGQEIIRQQSKAQRRLLRHSRRELLWQLEQRRASICKGGKKY